MPSDWIKMRTDLYRDPKVCAIADLLMQSDSSLARFVNQHCQCDMAVTRNVMRNVTVGALVSVWGVCRIRGKRDGIDLVISGMTSAVVDDVADLPGFGDAMMEVGWLVQRKNTLIFPRFFEDWNVDPNGDGKEKNRERQRKFREKRNGVSNVTRNVISNDREEREREREKRRDSLSEGEEVSHGKKSSGDSRSDSPASPDPPPRNTARMHWLANVERLFSHDTKQRLSDKTSAERMFDEVIWPDDGEVRRCADGYRKALDLIKRSSGRTNRMAWITKVLNEELA